MNLKEWAQQQGVHPVTAYRWFREGVLPVPARRVGRLILVGDVEPEAAGGATVVYARVSSADKKADLDRQVARVTTWATEHGLAVDRIVTEVGSALNGRREKFLELLTSLCIRLYGERAAANRAARAVAVAMGDAAE